MNFERTAFRITNLTCPAIVSLLLLIGIFSEPAAAQTDKAALTLNDFQTTPLYGKHSPDAAAKNFNVNKDFRVEKLSVEGGSEIITIFANLKGLSSSPQHEEVPLIAILRDTLGDDKAENDRLRYVWMLTYAKPSFAQKVAAVVPFLNARTTNKGKAGTNPPPPIMDLNPSENDVWDKVFWLAFKNLILGDFNMPVKAATHQYRENISNYRKSAIARTLAVLSLYESVEGGKILTGVEMKDIQARMMLSDKPLGSFMKTENLERVYQSNFEKIRDLRGQNWELLRQSSEAQGLYFEPLEMPDGSATHALVWVAFPDLITNKDRTFDSRFLNIKKPWNDARLKNWQGYSEIRWFDEENRPVEPNTPNATPKTMIPLALYGLDYPKIPTLLVDFRDRYNPKKREMSRRVLDDLTRNVLSISKFGNMPYFVGRYVYDFVTGRRGMDVNQASRFRSYSQLKLLLSLNASLEPEFRNEITNRLEAVSLNPLENDLDVEAKLAREQHANLIAYAKRPDGLAAQIDKDRREEMSRLKHGGKQRALFAVAHLLSFGAYTHREKNTAELHAQMDVRRQLDYHERYLLEVARASARPEVDSDVEAIKNSLAFISQNGMAAQAKTSQAIAKLFSITGDEQIRALALSSLYRINNSTAKKELLALYENQKLEPHWRALSAQYLKQAVKEEQRISSNDVKAIIEIEGGQ